MTDQKKFLPKLKVYAPEDLSKNWFIHYIDENGQRQRIYKGINKYNKQEERRAAIRRIMSKISRDGVVMQKTIQVLIYEVIEENKTVWRKKTYQTIKSKADIFFNWCGNRKIDNQLIISFFKYLKQSRYCTTHNNYLVKLKQLFKTIGEEHLFDGISNVKEYRRPARFFQPHQIERLKIIISSKNPELWLFMQFMYYCFIRPGELIMIKASDIIFDDSKIIIRSEVSKNRKTQYVAIPKAFKMDLSFVKRLNPNEFIFPSPNDASKPIGLNTMSTRHRSILNDLQCGQEYKLYSWKHTGAVQAVKAGVSIKELQLQLRHHSLDQVNDYLRQMGVSDLTKLKDNFPAI